jgi:hypothetical protein
MIISHSLSLIYISNPKTGTTSIEAALSEFDEEPHLNEMSETGLYTKRHMPAYLLRTRFPQDIWNSYYKFSFVRNPWDWFISQRFYNLQKNDIEYDPNRLLTTEDVLDTYDYLKIARGSRWVDSAAQHPFLCDENGNLLIDFLGRYESLKHHFRKVLHLKGIEKELTWLNTSDHRDYKYYYTEETKQLVGHLYRQDISIFQYMFD